MKKTVGIVLALMLILVMAFGLFACDKIGKDDGGKTTGTFKDAKLQKVEQALNGVEASMTKGDSGSLSVAAEKNVYLSGSGRSATASVEKTLRLAAGDTASDALSSIRGIYESGDKQTTASADLDYDQPPMKQFRYLKAIFEEMGDDYVLGTKYYYDITGQMYFDSETGFRVDAKNPNAADHLYNYVFGFAMSIELRENDLIFAEVAFKICLTHGDTEYNTSWYVSFDLNYDFNSSKPTYTLLMYTDNKEGDLAYLRQVQGYEYDYVDVNKGDIVEWRKFVMDVDREITVGGKYASFEDYIAEGAEYNADTAKWLKDGSLYKVTQLTPTKNRTLAIAFADGLGMNSTAINGAQFLAKSGTQSTLIDKYYKMICELSGEDLIYDLVCKDEDEHGGNGGTGVSTGAWANVVASIFPSDLLPTFTSESATFSVEQMEVGILIHLYNVGHDDYHNYAEALAAAGFYSQGNEIYLKEQNGKAFIVSINKEQNAIFAGESQGTSKKEPITIEGGYVYDDPDYDSYERNSITDYLDLSMFIKECFSEVFSVDNFKEVSTEGSYWYDIELAYSSATEDLTAERYAADKAQAYSGKYIKDGWTNRHGNMAHYTSGNNKDIVVLIGSGALDSEAHVYIYVLIFGEGRGAAVIEGEVKEDNNDTPDNDPPASAQFTVMLWHLGEEKQQLYADPLYCYEGDVINISEYLTGKEKAYRDELCSDEILDGSIEASDGLTIYLWEEHEAVSKGAFTVYMVSEKGLTLVERFECSVGEAYYSGSYIVYFDEGCTEEVPKKHAFTMTESGIDLYTPSRY